MSSFQDIFAYGPTDHPDQHPPRPLWLPPEDELGVCVPLSIVAARSENAVVALTHATAFSTGVGFQLFAAARNLDERTLQRLFHEQHLLAGEAEPPDGLLRVGIELSDGERISNLGNPHHHLWQPGAEPEGPLLIPHGGGGGSGGSGRITLSPGYWLWPLPGRGLLRLYVEWPALDIALTHVELDSDVLLEAAKRSRQVWDD